MVQTVNERKITALNSLEIVDFSCGGGECEYVIVADSEENRSVLLEAGFTTEELNEVSYDGYLDVAMLAWASGANWFDSKSGFSTRGEDGESA